MFQKITRIQSEEDREYVLVDTAEACREALAVLRESLVLAVDCEGRSLSRNGTLALVQVSNERNQCFIFDLVPGDNFAVFFDLGLRALLESTDVMKVMHDCRSDADALGHLAHVTLRNVVDTQIAYALHQMSTCNSLPYPMGYSKLVLFVSLYNPLPLRESPTPAHHNRTTLHVENPLKARIHMTMDADKEFWHRRPLPRDALEYAALDVLLMLPMYGVTLSWLSDAERIQLRAYSNQRVVNMNAAVPPETVISFGGRTIPKYGVEDLDKVCGFPHTFSNSRTVSEQLTWMWAGFRLCVRNQSGWCHCKHSG